jgi:hypothetical protein
MVTFIEIEKPYPGPSKLDQRLEAYRNSISKHILLTPEIAGKILLETLLNVYRDGINRSQLPGRPSVETSSKIEALDMIYRSVRVDPGTTEPSYYDYDTVRKGIEYQRAQKKEKGSWEEEVKMGGVSSGSQKPSQPEI